MVLTPAIVNQEVLDLEGYPIIARDMHGRPIAKRGSTTEPELITVKSALRQALVTTTEAVKETDEQKYKGYKLAQRIMRLKVTDDSIKLSAEQLTHLKQKIANIWGPEVQGYLFDLLEGVEDIVVKATDNNLSAVPATAESETTNDQQ